MYLYVSWIIFDIQKIKISVVDHFKFFFKDKEQILECAGFGEKLDSTCSPNVNTTTTGNLNATTSGNLNATSGGNLNLTCNLNAISSNMTLANMTFGPVEIAEMRNQLLRNI